MGSAFLLHHSDMEDSTPQVELLLLTSSHLVLSEWKKRHLASPLDPSASRSPRLARDRLPSTGSGQAWLGAGSPRLARGRLGSGQAPLDWLGTGSPRLARDRLPSTGSGQAYLPFTHSPLTEYRILITDHHMSSSPISSTLVSFS
jgi:hypothetical protein